MGSQPSKQTLAFIGVLFSGVVSAFFVDWPWASFIANFVYLLGLTQGLFAIVVLLYLLGVPWVKNYIVPSGVITLSFAPMAVFVLLSLQTGGEAISHWSRLSDQSSWFTSSAFFVRNLGTLLAFYFSVYHVTKRHRLDQGRHPRGLVILLILFVVNQSVVALDFGVNLSPGWHSTLFAPYYWFGGLYAGLAVLMGIELVKKKSRQMGPENAANLRRLLLTFSSIWAYLWWSQYLPIWYANLPEETNAFYSRFSGEVSLLSGLMFILLFLVPFISTFLVKRYEVLLKPVLIMLLFGAWIERYLIVVPPIRHLNKNVAAVSQHFTWIDGLMTISFFACFLLLLSINQRRFSKLLAV